MRELKFRDWDTADGETHQMQYSKNYSSLNEYFSMVNADNLMQYTGIKDKNGKEIYEGDILLESAPRGMKGEVIFDDGGYSIKRCMSALHKQGVEFYEWEIIGNIYETPDLVPKQP